MPEYTFRVLLTKELTDDGLWWVAQGLDHDIVAQGRGLADVQYAFELQIAAHVLMAAKLGTQPFANVPPAPEEYFDAWRKEAAPVDVADYRPSIKYDVPPELVAAHQLGRLPLQVRVA